MIDFSRSYAKGSDIVARNNPNGTVVLMRMDDSEVFYKIDGVAATCWKLLIDSKSPEDICQEVVKQYKCSYQQIKEDLSKLIEDLVSKSIIH